MATVAVGADPNGLAYAADEHEVLVANQGSGTVSVIADANFTVLATVAVGLHPFGIAVDDAQGVAVVSNLGSANVSVLSLATNKVVGTVHVGAQPEGVAYDPSSGEVLVANSGSSNVSLLSVSTSTDRVVANVAVGSEPSAVAFDAAQSLVLVANAGSFNVSEVNTTSSKVVGTISVGWKPVALAVDPATSQVLVANAGEGTLSFVGASSLDYIIFTETGLPAGKSWTGAVNGTAVTTEQPTIAFREPAGTYDYLVEGPAGYEATGPAAGGSIALSSAGASEAFIFEKNKTYSIGFHAAHLPKGQRWCVLLSGWDRCSTTKVDLFQNLTPGTYAYAVQPLTNQTITAKVGKTVVALTGQVTVPKSAALVITYVYPYEVSFTESGLPSGTNWSVSVDGVTHESVDGAVTLSFELPNGSYPYRIVPVTGYVGKGLPDPVKVVGSGVAVEVTFTAKAHKSVPMLSPVGLLLVLPGAVVLGRRRPRAA